MLKLFNSRGYSTKKTAASLAEHKVLHVVQCIKFTLEIENHPGVAEFSTFPHSTLFMY